MSVNHLRSIFQYVTMYRKRSRMYWATLLPVLNTLPRSDIRHHAHAELKPWLKSLAFVQNDIWLAPPAISFAALSFLDTLCVPGSKIFEYGASGATRYFSARARSLTVVEVDTIKCDTIRRRLERLGGLDWSVEATAGTQIDADMDSPASDPLSYREDDGVGLHYATFARTIEDHPDNEFDIVYLADKVKASCFMHAVAKIKFGGYIVVTDAANPSNTSIRQMAEQLGFDELSYVGLAPGECRPVETLFLKKVNKHHALNDIDLKLERHLNFNNGFFIEAGGNNGIRQSNSYYFEACRGWRGMLVEAIPSLAMECRRHRPHAIVEQVALTSPDHVPGTVEVQFAGLMSLVKGSMTSDIDQATHVEKGCEIQGIESYVVTVQTATLSGLLDKHGINNVDLLSLDVEGFERQVLGGLDFERHAPTYILVEERYPDVAEFLMKRYDMIEKISHHDVLYRLKSKPNLT